MNKQEIEKAVTELNGLLEAGIRGLDLEIFGQVSENSFRLAVSALTQQLTDAWIPVTEKLPEEPSQRVLVTLKNEMVLEVWYINNDFKFHESLGRGGLEKISEYNPVIAWQPLPEPYKTPISKEESDAERN